MRLLQETVWGNEMSTEKKFVRSRQVGNQKIFETEKYSIEFLLFKLGITIMFGSNNYDL